MTALVMLSVQPRDIAGAASDGSLRLVESNTSHVVVEFTLPNYRITQEHAGQDFVSVLSADGLLRPNEPGIPELPSKSTMVGIPFGATPSFHILADDSTKLALAQPIKLGTQADAPATDLQTSLPAWQGANKAPGQPAFDAKAMFPQAAAAMSGISTLRSQRYVAVTFNPFQVEALSKGITVHRSVRVEITFAYRQGMTTGAIGEALDEPQLDLALRSTLLNFDTARQWRARVAPSTVGLPKVQSASAGNPLFRISTPSDGIYQITCPGLQAAGLSAGSYDPTTLKVLYRGAELAMVQAGAWSGACAGSDYLLFYAEKVQSIYTDTNIYWLTVGGAAGKRALRVDGSGSGSPGTDFPDVAHYEVNTNYFRFPGLPENLDHWYWQIPAPAFTKGFHLDNPAPIVYTATLNIRYIGLNTAAHDAVTFLNGTQVADASWFGQSIYTGSVPIPQSLLDPITNTITFSEANGYPTSIIALDFFEIQYARTFSVTNDSLHFKQPVAGAWQYQVSGFGTSAVSIFDISDKYSMTQIISASNTLVGGLTQVQFVSNLSNPGEYIVLTAPQFKTPSSIVRAATPHLTDPSNAADYIMISYGGFIPNVQPLATFRASQGMRVQIVDVQDIYDEFSGGLMDAQAIHDFLAYAYAHWQAPAPFYVLLVGDGQYDFKNYFGTSSANYIPPYMRDVDPITGEAATDNRLVAFNLPTDRMPSMAIGRLPANNTSEVDAMVSKILAYDQNPPPGSWRSTVTFVSDNAYQADGSPDGGGNFWNLSDEIANNPQYFPSALKADRIYFNPCTNIISFPNCALPYTPAYTTATQVTSGIIGAINAGRVLVSYVGHAAPNFWAGTPTLYHTSDIDLLSNGGKLPMILAMTCYDGAFDIPSASSMAEVHVRKPNAGAIASWSSTGQGFASGHDYLEKGFFDSVVNAHQYRLGPATIAGELNVNVNSPSNLDLIDTFILFGDPATKLAIMPSGLYLPLVTR